MSGNGLFQIFYQASGQQTISPLFRCHLVNRPDQTDLLLPETRLVCNLDPQHRMWARYPIMFGIQMVECIWFMVLTIWKPSLVSGLFQYIDFVLERILQNQAFKMFSLWMAFGYERLDFEPSLYTRAARLSLKLFESNFDESAPTDLTANLRLGSDWSDQSLPQEDQVTIH